MIQGEHPQTPLPRLVVSMEDSMLLILEIIKSRSEPGRAITTVAFTWERNFVPSRDTRGAILKAISDHRSDLRRGWESRLRATSWDQTTLSSREDRVIDLGTHFLNRDLIRLDHQEDRWEFRIRVDFSQGGMILLDHQEDPWEFRILVGFCQGGMILLDHQEDPWEFRILMGFCQGEEACTLRYLKGGVIPIRIIFGCQGIWKKKGTIPCSCNV
mmetsp:Transcript_19723/g.44783  ORF Transcript_19723/g.44783 Transcript_19723/m.44783 type:complete len:214 (-) Transcript_19723:149-790(-)